MKRFHLKIKTKDFLKSNTEKPETAGPSAEMSQLNRQTVPTTQKKKGCRSVRKVISALFNKLCPWKVHGENTNDINVIPPAVTRDNVTVSVNKIDTAGGKEIVPTSEKKTEATRSTKHVHTSEIKTEATSSTKHVHTSEIKTEATSSTKHVHTSEIKTEATSSTKHVHTSEIKTEATSSTKHVHTSEIKTEATSSTKPVHTSEIKTEATSSTKPVHTSEIKTEATSSTKPVHTSEIKTEATSSTKPVHTSEIKTEATSSTKPVHTSEIKTEATSCACLPRRKYRLGKKKCVPPPTTQEEPAEDRPHTSREFVPQGSTPKGKQLFFGCGKAFLCPPFCCCTKVDTEYEHKNYEKDDVPTLIGQAETTSSLSFEKTAPIDRQIEVTAAIDIDFDQRSEIVVEPKDGIEISIPTETVSIPESGIEIIAIMDHELDQKSTIPSTKTKDIVETVPTLEDGTASTTDGTASTTRTASTPDKTASPDGAVLPRGKISRDDSAHLPIAQEEPEENKSKPREESVQPFQPSSTPAVRGQPVVSKVKSYWIKIKKSIFKEISQIKSPARGSLTSKSFKYYKILGEGHYGRVLLASHPSTNQPLAIKIAIKPLWPNLAERQVMEATEGSRFFPQLFATFQEEDLLFYVMEYVDSWTLKQFMYKRKRLDEDTIRFIAAELLCALQSLHSRDIAHCDLHTDNILLDSSGHVKVIDFGTAKILEHSPCERESPRDFQNRRNALHKDFLFFYNVVSEMSDLRDAQTYKTDDDALLDLVKKCEFSFEQLQNHRFFAGINWNEMEAGNINPPYIMEPSSEINRSKQIDVKGSIRDLLRKIRFRRVSQSAIYGFDFLSERWRDMQQHQ